MQLQKYTNGGFENNTPDYIINNLSFIGTCGSHPESYDVVNQEGYQVGYIRLRGGWLRAYIPDVGGVAIFTDTFEDKYKGSFDTEDERMYYLTLISAAINEEIESTS